MTRPLRSTSTTPHVGITSLQLVHGVRDSSVCEWIPKQRENATGFLKVTMGSRFWDEKIPEANGHPQTLSESPGFSVSQSLAQPMHNTLRSIMRDRSTRPM